jgi:hypothetical protein
MGWLGWTPEVALAADVNAVRMALQSRSKLLEAIFGSPDRPRRGKKVAAKFKEFAAQHNRRFSATDGK